MKKQRKKPELIVTGIRPKSVYNRMTMRLLELRDMSELSPQNRKHAIVRDTLEAEKYRCTSRYKKCGERKFVYCPSVADKQLEEDLSLCLWGFDEILKLLAN